MFVFISRVNRDSGNPLDGEIWKQIRLRTVVTAICSPFFVPLTRALVAHYAILNDVIILRVIFNVNIPISTAEVLSRRANINMHSPRRRTRYKDFRCVDGIYDNILVVRVWCMSGRRGKKLKLQSLLTHLMMLFRVDHCTDSVWRINFKYFWRNIFLRRFNTEIDERRNAEKKKTFRLEELKIRFECCHPFCASSFEWAFGLIWIKFPSRVGEQRSWVGEADGRRSGDFNWALMGKTWMLKVLSGALWLRKCCHG